MKIGILGAGNVGGNLGQAWAAHGHEIVFGVRDPQSAKVRSLLNKIGRNARAASVSEAASFGEVIVLAVNWSAVPDVLHNAGDLSGKILVDATNRITPGASDRAPSAAEHVAELAPGTRVVKAFNTIGADHFTNPWIGSESASMFICGDDADAKAIVAGLAQELGFDVVDAGPLSNAHLLESLALLWIRLSRSLGRNIGFKLLRG